MPTRNAHMERLLSEATSEVVKHGKQSKRNWLLPITDNLQAPGGPLQYTLTGHSSPVWSLASISSNMIASASDANIRFWNITSGECVRVVNSGHTGPIHSLLAIEDGRLASGAFDNTIRIQKISSSECLQVLTGHTAPVGSLVYLSHNLLASASSDKTVRIWDLSTGECKLTLLGHSMFVTSVTVLGSDRLASASWDTTVRIWDTRSGKCLRTLSKHTGAVNCVAYIRDDCLASASDDKSILLWNVSTGECLSPKFKGHTNAINGLAVMLSNDYAGDSDRIASASEDTTTRIWRIRTGECLVVLKNHSSIVNCVAYVRHNCLATGSYDKTIRIWDATMAMAVETTTSLLASTNILPATTSSEITCTVDITAAPATAPKKKQCNSTSGCSMQGAHLFCKQREITRRRSALVHVI